jgi:hypothetical protein
MKMPRHVEHPTERPIHPHVPVVIGRLLAIAAASGALGCQGGERACPGLVEVICVGHQAEAEQLNAEFSGACGPSYEVCGSQEASFTPRPEAGLGSLFGDGGFVDARPDASYDAATDAAADAVSGAIDQ